MSVQVSVTERRHFEYQGTVTVDEGEDTVTITAPGKVPAGKQMVLKVQVHGVLRDKPEPPPEP